MTFLEWIILEGEKLKATKMRFERPKMEKLIAAIQNASHHFFQFNMVSNFAKLRGVPMAGTAVIAGGVLLLLGG